MASLVSHKSQNIKHVASPASQENRNIRYMASLASPNSWNIKYTGSLASHKSRNIRYMVSGFSEELERRWIDIAQTDFFSQSGNEIKRLTHALVTSRAAARGGQRWPHWNPHQATELQSPSSPLSESRPSGRWPSRRRGAAWRPRKNLPPAKL